jgi:hypothetical protein
MPSLHVMGAGVLPRSPAQPKARRSTKACDTLEGAKVGGRDECPVNSYLTEGRYDDEKKYGFAVRVAGSSVGAG